MRKKLDENFKELIKKRLKLMSEIRELVIECRQIDSEFFRLIEGEPSPPEEIMDFFASDRVTLNRLPKGIA